MSYHKVIFEKWFDKDNRVISLINFKKPWKENGNPPMFKIRTNGGRKRHGDNCFDFYIHFGYLVFNYCHYNMQNN